MSAQRFDGKQYIPDQASDSTDGADVGVHDLLLETIKALTAERDALVNAVAERDVLREQVRVLRNAAQGYARAGLALQRAVGLIDGPELERLRLYTEWERACLKHGQLMEALAQTAETEGR